MNIINEMLNNFRSNQLETAQLVRQQPGSPRVVNRKEVPQCTDRTPYGADSRSCPPDSQLQPSGVFRLHTSIQPSQRAQTEDNQEKVSRNTEDWLTTTATVTKIWTTCLWLLFFLCRAPYVENSDILKRA